MRALHLIGLLSYLLLLPSAPASAAGVGELCDGKIGIQCDAGLWCEHPAGQCSVVDGAGTCVKETGPICIEVYMPVCACGGVQYSNDCKRKTAKAQLDYVGECTK
jgi:hypothetical protein